MEKFGNRDERTSDGRLLRDHLMENQLWYDIRRMATTNITLQDALNKCILIYKLSKEHS